MAFSVNTPVGDGVTKQFAVNFTNGLFSRDSVHVFVEGEVDGLGEPAERTFTWINDGLIELDGAAPGSGVVVNIRRIMDKDEPAVDFEDGEILTEATADRGLDHLLNSIHELLDGYGFESIRTDMNLNGNLIRNLGEPTEPTDAARLSDIRESASAAVLRQELQSSDPAQGSDLIAHTGTSDTVTEALDNRVIRVSSRTEMKAYDVSAGYQFSLEEGGRSGIFVVKSGTPPSDPLEGIYVVLSNGQYAERTGFEKIDIRWFGAVKDETGVDSYAAIQAAIDIVPLINNNGGFRYGQEVVFPAGEYETSQQINIYSAGVRLVGQGSVTSVIKAQTGFTGDAVIYATPPNTTATLVGHGVVGLGIDCNLQGCDGYVGEMLYDNILFDDFRISQIAAAQSGFVSQLKPGHTLPVNQTVSIRKLFSNKVTEAGTVPSVIIKNTQEIMVQESKAWNSNVASSGDQPAWLIDSCRSLTMISCSYINSKIGLRVTTTDRSCDQIQIIAPLYENVGTPVKIDSGAGTLPIDNFYHSSPRHQNAGGDGYDIDRTRTSFLETKSMAVTLGANSETTTVATNSLPLVTDNGTDNMRVSIRNAVNDFEQFGHNLSIRPGNDEFFRTGATANELGGTVFAGFLIGGSYTFKQVFAGASDSAGTGFRQLRITN
jgi:hypothetical protein